MFFECCEILKTPPPTAGSRPQCEIEHFINWIRPDTTVSDFYNRITHNETTILCDINHPARKDGMTLLHIACEVENLPLTRALIYAGAHVNAKLRTDTSSTPLDFALRHHNPELIHLLIRSGAHTVNGISAWFKETDDMEIHESDKMEKILFIRKYFLMHSIKDYRPAFNKRIDWYSDFINFVRKDNVPYVREILENTDIDVNGYNPELVYRPDSLVTPIHIAAAKGYLQMVKLLVAHGALIIEDDWGMTTSEMARRNNHQDIADFLENTQSDRYQRLKQQAEIPKKYQLVLLGIFSDRNCTLHALGKHPDVARVITEHALAMEYC